MNPKVFALAEDMTAGEAITALQGSRDVEMVFYLYVVDARRHLVGVVSLRRLLLVSPDDAAQADHDDRHRSASASTWTRRRWRGRSPPTTCSRSRSSTRRTSWSASSPSTTSSTSSRTKRPRTSIASPAWPATSACSRRPSESLRKRLPWLIVNLATAFLAASVVALFQNTIEHGRRRWRSSCRSSPAWAATRRRRR